MSERLIVHRDGNPIYDIVVEPTYGNLGREIESLKVHDRKLCIVTDSNVGPLYLEAVRSQIAPHCKQVNSYLFPAGEEHKNLDTVRGLYEYLILEHYDRQDILVALGGGVTGDLCGFAAATFLRGIRFIQLPTTLLAQVDSSIGGKTGVDFDSYKNMVGAFHMPILVYTSTETLNTLSEEQFACGMGEVVKHGLIKSDDYYDWLKHNTAAILRRDYEVCEQMILQSNRIKRDVVELDPTEQGERALLNYGHTLGHAIEKRMDFKLLHGQCVALGCAAASHLSARRGMISHATARDICQTLSAFHLPVTTIGLNLSNADIIAATKNDKKMDSGLIKFILLRRLGAAYVDRSVTDEEMAEALDWLAGGVDG